LLRQAEAACDYVRALATLLDLGGNISMPDGGVGDDKGETTLRASDSPDVVSVWSPDWDRLAEIDGLPPSLSLFSTQHGPGSPQPFQERATWLPIGASQRHAWLQLLLI
jgi:hypothetical protein